MRPLEWLVIVAFAPLMMTLLIGSGTRRHWMVVASMLPFAACVWHIVAEGWRLQMAPLYLLAVLAFLGAPLGLAKRRTPLRRGSVAASIIVAVVLVPSTIVAGWLLPVVSLPAPTGPYQVGIVDREVVDEARGRRLMATVWYPAATAAAPAPLTRHPDELMTALANLTGLPSPLFHHLRYVTLAASEGTPVLTDAAPFPVLVFSHGLVGMRLQSSSTLQDLASWGYVVAAVDHTDAAAVTVFPDGETRYYDPERFGVPADSEPTTELIDDRLFPVWVADQRAVYDALEAWQINDPLFGGRLDLGRIGSFGHSFGGATALDVCLVDVRCRGAVDMDGGVYGESQTASATRPIMVMSSTDSLADAEATAAWDAVVERADTAYWLEIPGSSHLSFTFSELLSPLLAPPGFDPRDGLAAVNRYLLAFFDLHLRQANGPPLAPSAETSEVRWLTE